MEKLFNEYKFKFSIYSSIKDIIKVKDKVFEKNDKNADKIDLFINLENKLITFNFNSYSIKSYKALDELKKSKIIDYSLEIS